MLIGEIVNKTKLTRDTIRFYEKKGLIKVNRTDSEWNNYKNYNEETLNRLFLIKKAKGFGFTLNEIAELLEMFDMNIATCEIMAIKVKEKLTRIDEKIKGLNEMKVMILDKIEKTQNECSLVSKNNCENF